MQAQLLERDGWKMEPTSGSNSISGSIPDINLLLLHLSPHSYREQLYTSLCVHRNGYGHHLTCDLTTAAGSGSHVDSSTRCSSSYMGTTWHLLTAKPPEIFYGGGKTWSSLCGQPDCAWDS